MGMNVKPIPTLDDEINEIRLAIADIVNTHILPNENRLWGWLADSANATNEVKAEAKALREEIQNTVKQENLWAPHLPREFGGMGLSFLQHARHLYLGWWRPTPVIRRSWSNMARRNSMKSGCSPLPTAPCNPGFP